MRLPRFSIANLLALIAILAVALAALRSPSYLWANVTFSFALGAVVLAVINVVFSHGAGRAYWLGFALCGGVYLAICSLPVVREAVCTRLATEAVLDFIYPHLAPASTAPPTVAANTVWTAPGQARSKYMVAPITPTMTYTLGNTASAAAAIDTALDRLDAARPHHRCRLPDRDRSVIQLRSVPPDRPLDVCSPGGRSGSNIRPLSIPNQVSQLRGTPLSR